MAENSVDTRMNKYKSKKDGSIAVFMATAKTINTADGDEHTRVDDVVVIPAGITLDPKPAAKPEPKK